MEQQEKYLRFTRAASLGSVASSITVALLTIGGEEWAPLKDMLKNVFSHHWLGKSALALLTFVAAFVIFARTPADVKSASTALWAAVGAALASSAAMAIFFALHAWGLI